MADFVAGARRASASNNWYAAIALALTLPDICAAVDDPGKANSALRYARWWDTYVASRYEVRPDPDDDWASHTYLPGVDAFSLRCAYLHSGTDALDNKDKVMNRIRFMTPPSSKSFGLHEPSRTLTLAVDRFVEWVCIGVECWIEERKGDDAAHRRLQGLLGLTPSAMIVTDWKKNEDDERSQSARVAGRAETLTELKQAMDRIEGLFQCKATETADFSQFLAMWLELRKWVQTNHRNAKRDLINARTIVGRLTDL